MYTQNNNYECERIAGVSKGNMAKYGAVIVKNVPIDMSSGLGGSDPWRGWGRFLPYRYDTHLLTNPPPAYVKVPNSVTQAATVTITIGASYYLGTQY